MKRQRLWIWLAALVLIAATALAYANGLRSAFIFDDSESIAENPSIRELASWRIFQPPHGGITASGRPLFNATLALNWAWTGTQVWSYHLVNVAGHICAGLLLFGLARRTLQRLQWAAGSALAVAFAIALLWLLHPLQTEAVTYIVQRSEMMAGLFYIAVIYCLVRLAEAQEAPDRRRAVLWGGLGAAACVAGMLSKEVMVSAPVTALLYDRAFLSGSFRAAWNRRRSFWIALALTWVPLGCEVWANRGRGGTAGLGVHGITAVQYWETQGPAIGQYLKLAFWPRHLVLDYWVQLKWIEHPLAALPSNLAVALLALAALWLVVAAPRWGVLAFVFFALLAPTSLIPGNRQSLAEHRMYLALAPLVAVAALGLWRWVARQRPVLFLALVTAAACLYGARVHARNEDYDNPERLWRKNLREVPDNAYAWCNLGAVLNDKGRIAAAEGAFREAAAVAPSYGAAESNLGVVLVAEGKPEEALPHLQRALKLTPTSFQANNNMGVALVALQRWEEAVPWYERALALHPDYPDARRNLALARQGAAEAHFRAGIKLAKGGSYREAIAEYRAALRWNPDLAGAYANEGSAWLALGDATRAVADLQTSVRLAPGSAPCHYNLGVALEAAGRPSEALDEYEIAARLAPGLSEVQQALKRLLHHPSSGS